MDHLSHSVGSCSPFRAAQLPVPPVVDREPVLFIEDNSTPAELRVLEKTTTAFGLWALNIGRDCC